MKAAVILGLTIPLALATAPARAADNLAIERLATCQDSWFEWKTADQPRLQRFVETFHAEFPNEGKAGAYRPRSSQTIAGMPVVQVYPQSVGMGVGFSVIVDANFDTAKATLEKRLGRPIRKCEPPSDNMRTCELDIGEKKTVTLMAEDNPKATTTLVGCYYFYEK